MRIIIIGAGLTGLSAYEQLKDKGEVIVFEKNSQVGGLTRTEQNKGFRFDHAGHFLHFNHRKTEKKVTSYFKKENISKVQRKSYIFSKNRYIPYPFQSHIYYLPLEIKKECLLEFLKTFNYKEKYAEKNFYSWMTKKFGKGIVKYFMLPYNKKLWAVHPSSMTTEWMSRFVPKPSPEEIITGALSKGKKGQGYNAYFHYPRYGIGELSKKMVSDYKDIRLNSKVEEVDWEKKTIKVNGREYEYDYLISTIPLKEFILEILEPKDSNLSEKAKRLKHNSVLNINIGWEGNKSEGIPEGASWIYFPEQENIFYRVGFPANISSDMVPKKCWSCFVEIAYQENKFPSKEKYKELERKVIKRLKELKIIPSDVKIKVFVTLAINPAYVIYDKNWKESRDFLLKYLEAKNMFSGGRYGGWEYSTMEEAIEWGERLALKCQ